MSLNRRDFLELTLKGAFVIGAGNILQSCTKEFTLPEKNNIDYRFAVASDGHYGQIGTPYELYHDEMIHLLNYEKEERGLEFSVINGDMIDNDPSFLAKAKKKWDALNMPYYVTHGNHDTTSYNYWQKVWSMPVYHTFELNDSAFLILNTASEKGDFICPDYNWTKQQLEKYLAYKHLFVFMHITPFPWTTLGISCPAITNMFSQQHNLRAIFNGHDHFEDGVKEGGGKCYFFDSHIGSLSGTYYRGYRIVEVLKNGDVLTYQVNPITNKMVNANSIKVKTV